MTFFLRKKQRKTLYLLQLIVSKPNTDIAVHFHFPVCGNHQNPNVITSNITDRISCIHLNGDVQTQISFESPGYRSYCGSSVSFPSH